MEFISFMKTTMQTLVQNQNMVAVSLQLSSPNKIWQIYE